MMDKDEMYNLLDDLYEDDPGLTDDQLALALGENGVSRDEAYDAIELWRPGCDEGYTDENGYFIDDEDDEYLW